jgi:hypothetical protein
MQLEEAYTHLANAIESAGKEKREVFLAMLSLKLLSQQTDTQQALALIDEVLHEAKRTQGGSDAIS